MSFKIRAGLLVFHPKVRKFSEMTRDLHYSNFDWRILIQTEAFAICWKVRCWGWISYSFINKTHSRTSILSIDLIVA